MTSSKPPTENKPTANDDAEGTSTDTRKPLPRLPDPEGCTVEELLKAYPHMFDNT